MTTWKSDFTKHLFFFWSLYKRRDIDEMRRRQ